MDMNEYALEVLVYRRLEEMRAERERWGRFDGESPAAPPLRVALGHALIRLGERLQPGRERALDAAEAMRAIHGPGGSTHRALRG